MTKNNTRLISEAALSASWVRCERKHQMERSSARHATMRLLSSEITPRLEALLDRAAGNRRLLRQLAIISAQAGQCTVLTDASGIIVMLDSGDGRKNTDDWNGIALGSCWDERIAGTNGVAMAMLEEQQVTVRGSDHYLTKLSHFTCSATPLLDADNHMIGVLSLAAIDRSNTVDYLFARQMLDTTARQIQRNLFERKYQEVDIYSIAAPPEEVSLIRSDELVAVDEAGIILGSTIKASTLLGLSRQDNLTGKSFELLFGNELESLRMSRRLANIGNRSSVLFNLQTQLDSEQSGQIRQALNRPAGSEKQTPRLCALNLSLRELSVGCQSMQNICARAETFYHRGLPFLVEGASGTGKSAIITALLNSVEPSAQSVVSIDCATLSEDTDDQRYIKTLLQQVLLEDSWNEMGKQTSTLIFDNVDELPAYAQAGLRNLLNKIENKESACIKKKQSVRIIATCRHSLQSMVERNCFRDDLYYLLANAAIRVPALLQREKPELLIQDVANRIAGQEVEITTEALNALSSYEWPGNVRQLRSILQQALLEGNGQRISLIDLGSTAVCDVAAKLPIESRVPSGQVVKVVYDEKTRILDSLLSAHWNISQAARNLGMARATIHRKMKLHGIKRPSV